MPDTIGPPCRYCGAHCTENTHLGTGDYSQSWACGSWIDDNLDRVERSERCKAEARKEKREAETAAALRGCAQAARGEFVEGPDVDADLEEFEELSDGVSVSDQRQTVSEWMREWCKKEGAFYPSGPTVSRSLADKMVRDLMQRADDAEERYESLLPAILHGDDMHRSWLKQAHKNHKHGHPVPPPTGKGSAERIQQLTAERDAEKQRADDAIKAFEYLKDRQDRINTESIERIDQLTAACAEWREAFNHIAVQYEYDCPGDAPEACGWLCINCGGTWGFDNEPRHKPTCPASGTAGQSLLERLDAAECTLADEEAAHQDTLRLLKLRDAELESFRTKMRAADNVASSYTDGPLLHDKVFKMGTELESLRAAATELQNRLAQVKAERDGLREAILSLGDPRCGSKTGRADYPSMIPGDKHYAAWKLAAKQQKELPRDQ